MQPFNDKNAKASDEADNEADNSRATDARSEASDFRDTPGATRPRTDEGVVRFPQAAAHKTSVNLGKISFLWHSLLSACLTFRPKTPSGSSVHSETRPHKQLQSQSTAPRINSATENPFLPFS